MSKRQYDKASRAFAFAMKALGAIGIVFSVGFWAATSRVELGFLPVFVSLTTAGLGVDVLREIAEGRVRIPPEDRDDESY